MIIDLADRFTYHAPDSQKKEKHAEIRKHCMETARTIDTMVRDGREKSTALTKLEEVMFWANAGIAREK